MDTETSTTPQRHVGHKTHQEIRRRILGRNAMVWPLPNMTSIIAFIELFSNNLKSCFYILYLCTKKWKVQSGSIVLVNLIRDCSQVVIFVSNSQHDSRYRLRLPGYTQFKISILADSIHYLNGCSLLHCTSYFSAWSTLKSLYCIFIVNKSQTMIWGIEETQYMINFTRSRKILYIPNRNK